MKPRVLEPKPLTKEAFAPYGDVIETEGGEQFMINQGTCQCFHDLANLDVTAKGGRPVIRVFRAQPFPKPIEVTMMERHPLSSQAFIPMNWASFMVLVAPKGEQLDSSRLELFMSQGHQGVNYHAGVWHYPLLVLTPDQDFLVVDRGGEGPNCDEVDFPEGDSALIL